MLYWFLSCRCEQTLRPRPLMSGVYCVLQVLGGESPPWQGGIEQGQAWWQEQEAKSSHLKPQAWSRDSELEVV